MTNLSKFFYKFAFISYIEIVGEFVNPNGMPTDS